MSRALPGAIVSGAEVIEPDTDSMTVEDAATDSPVTVSAASPYMPFTVITQYQEAHTTTGIAGVFVILPSCLSAVDDGKYEVTVTPCGNFINIRIEWPKTVYDPAEVFKKFLNSTGPDGFFAYHPRYTAYIEALKKFRARASDPIVTNSRVPLPFRCQSKKEFEHNTSEQLIATRFELRSVDESYAPPTPNKPFEGSTVSGVTSASGGAA